MRRTPLSALALTAALATPAAALDLGAMSESEEAAFGAAVRSYLIENPEVLLEALEVLESRETAAQAEADESLIAVNAAALFDTETDWVGGNLEGDVTMVEFVDYRCGYCKRAMPEVAALLEEDGGIRLIRKDLPILGEQSVLAARFAIAVKTVAGKEAYGDVSEALMTMRGDVTDESLRQMANTFGLETDAIMSEMDSEATTNEIRENQLLAMRLHIQGTPAFVIGDELLRGYLPKDQLAQIVEGERGE